MADTRMVDRPARDVSINMRASQQQRSLIDRAAQALGKNRSDFMLEASCREAEAVLLDRRYFALDAETFEQFTAMLDARRRPIPGCAVCAEKAPGALATGDRRTGTMRGSMTYVLRFRATQDLDEWLRRRALGSGKRRRETYAICAACAWLHDDARQSANCRSEHRSARQPHATVSDRAGQAPRS